MIILSCGGNLNTKLREDSSAIFAEQDADNNGLLSSTEFAEMAKLAQVGRHEYVVGIVHLS
jgi:hypothetical protein